MRKPTLEEVVAILDRELAKAQANERRLNAILGRKPSYMRGSMAVSMRRDHLAIIRKAIDNLKIP